MKHYGTCITAGKWYAAIVVDGYVLSFGLNRSNRPYVSTWQNIWRKNKEAMPKLLKPTKSPQKHNTCHN